MKIFASKKKRFIFIGVIILLVLVLSVVLIIANRGIEDGFKFNIRYGVDLGERPSVAIAYKTQKRVFDIDNVTFDIYYGVFYPHDYDNSFISAKTYCRNKDSEVRLKYITETVYSNKYDIKEKNINKLFYYTLKYEFNYHETVKIPREVFVNDCGRFSIYFDVEHSSSRIVDSQTIYYQVKGDKIILSTNEFK